MTNHFTIREHVRKLEGSPCHEDLILQILQTYLELFPVSNSFLFRYSPLGYLCEGIISLTSSELTHIRDIRDDIRSLPGFHTAIRERKAKYISGFDYLKQVGFKYTMPSHVNSVLIVPICFNSVSLGYIVSNQFTEGTKFDDHLLSLLTLYGNLVGKTICGLSFPDNSENLSKREFEVIQKVAQGESTKEISESLELSELTVNQYIKSAIKKLGVQNRTQAVAELFRKGIIV